MLCKKAVSFFGFSIVVRSKLVVVLLFMVMVVLYNFFIVMLFVRCFFVIGEYLIKLF